MKACLKSMLQLVVKVLRTLLSPFDKTYLDCDVSEPKIVSHQEWQEHLYTLANKEGFKILEIGSREVTGTSEARERFDNAKYIGFDIIDGNNVDIVGDAHKLSTYFDKEQKFDLIYSSATFEHFAMPWLVASEISKLLKVDGYVFVETHFSHSSHERPSNFFQFSDLGLKVLFSEALGFQHIDSGMCNPIIGYFSSFSDKYLRYKSVTGLYCHSSFFGKKVTQIDNVSWDSIDVDEVIGDMNYPD